MLSHKRVKKIKNLVKRSLWHRLVTPGASTDLNNWDIVSVVFRVLFVFEFQSDLLSTRFRLCYI